MAGVRGRSASLSPALPISNQAYLRLPTYPSRPQARPLSRDFLDGSPFRPYHWWMEDGGRAQGHGGLASLLAARAGRAPPEGALFSRTVGCNSAGGRKQAAGLTQVSLRHARLHQASAEPAPVVGGVARPRSHPGGCTCERSGAGMLGTDPLSFVRGRRWGRCGPRGRAGTGREGAAGAAVEFWSVSLLCWARRAFEAAALFFLLLPRKKNSPARLGYSILWTQKCVARVLFCLAALFSLCLPPSFLCFKMWVGEHGMRVWRFLMCPIAVGLSQSRGGGGTQLKP